MEAIFALFVLWVIWTLLMAPDKSQSPEDVERRGRIREEGRWRTLLNRSDVLIIDVKTSDYSNYARLTYVAVIDTTGETLFVADFDKYFYFPTIHAELVSILREANQVLAWDVKFNKEVLSQEAKSYNLKPLLPRIRWRDLRDDYDTGGPSLRYAAKRERVKLHQTKNKALDDCLCMLDVMNSVIKDGVQVIHETSHTWQSLLNRADILIIDTKTTGVNKPVYSDSRNHPMYFTSEVLEVAVIDTTGTIRYQALVMPKGPIAAEVTAVRGFDRAALRAANAKEFTTVYGELLPLLREADRVLGWDVEFDKRILQRSAKRHNLKPLLQSSFSRVRWHDVMADYQVNTECYDALSNAVMHELYIGRNGKEHEFSDALAHAREEDKKAEQAGKEGHKALRDCRHILAVMYSACS